MRIRHILLTVFIWTLMITGASAEKRVALVIGNSAYQNVPKLTNPANDATMMAATLKKSGFDSVVLRPDVTKDAMRRALRDFADQTRDADIAVVYYAGHGIEIDGTNYLIPVDAVLERDTDVYDETYALDRVLVAMEPAKQLRLIILDACRDNPFNKSMKRSIGMRAIGTRGLAKVEPASPNTMIAFAAKAGSTAADGDGKNSPFATALANHLATPGMDLRKSFGYVRDDVMKVTNNRQEPFIYGSLGGNDVALVPAAATTAPPTAAPGPQFAPIDATDGIRRDYEMALQVGTKDAWDYFIANYPNGFYSDLARAQSKKLATLETPAQAAPTARTTSPAGPDADMPRQVLIELRRVGCYAGEPGSNWNAAAQRSLDLFNKYAGTRFDVKVASLDALEVIKGRTGSICPLTCQRGYQIDADKCVKITCKDGYEVGDDNTCERIVVRRPPPPRNAPPVAARPDRDAPPPRAAQAASSGQVFCPGGVCRPVARGCRVVNDTSTPGGIMNGGAMVCN